MRCSAPALLIGASGLSVFAATGMVGGSSFLAVYLFGLIVANRAAKVMRPILAAMDGYAWLGQAGMFLLLGLLVTPSRMLDSVAPALAVVLTMIFVARPVAVWLCLIRPMSGRCAPSFWISSSTRKRRSGRSASFTTCPCRPMRRRP